MLSSQAHFRPGDRWNEQGSLLLWLMVAARNDHAKSAPVSRENTRMVLPVWWLGTFSSFLLVVGDVYLFPSVAKNMPCFGVETGKDRYAKGLNHRGPISV